MPDDAKRPLVLSDAKKAYLKRALHEILHMHSVWVESGGQEGMQIIIGGADLRKARIYFSILDEAKIVHNRMWRVNLNSNDLRGSYQNYQKTGRLPNKWREKSRQTLRDPKVRLDRLDY